MKPSLRLLRLVAAARLGVARALAAEPLHVHATTVALSALPLWVLTVGCKAHKIAVSPEKLGWAKVVGLSAAVAMSDLGFCAAWIAVWAVLLALTGAKWLRNWAHPLLTWVVLLLSAGDHGFWISTGQLLDWNLIAYFFKHFEMIRPVLASEVRPLTVIAFVSLPVLAAWPLLLKGLRRRAHAGQIGRFTQVNRRQLRNTLVLLLGLAAVAPVVRTLPMPGALQPLARSEHYEVGKAAILAIFAREPTLDQLDGSKRMPQVAIGAQDPLKRHNVLLVVLESTRALATTPYAPGLATTPFLQELATKGTLVRHAFTLVPHTTKALVPIFCGVPPKLTPEYEEADHNGNPVTCLPKHLADKGYATIFMTPAEGSFELNRTLAEQAGFGKVLAREDFRRPDWQHHSKTFEENNYFGFEDRILIEPALQWVDAQKGPWMLAMLTLTAHHPYAVPKSWQRKNFGTPGQLDDYHNTVAYADDMLRQLWQGLVLRGHDKDTLLVVIGDHGEGFGEHGIYQHDEITYDEGLRVPLVVVGPGVPAGKSVDGLWQNLDVVPTLLDLLGISWDPQALPGRSVFSGKPHSKLQFSAWPRDKSVAVRTLTHKFIDFYDKRSREAFDLASDPSETKNIYELPKIKAQADAALTAARAWKQDVNTAYALQGKLRLDQFVNRLRPKIAHNCDIALDNGVRLVGWQLERDAVRAGDAIWLTTVWYVDRAPGKGWEIFAHMLGPENHFGRFDHVAVEGAYPVAQWQAGQYIVDRTRLAWSHVVPSGNYDVVMGLWNPDDGNRRAEPSGVGRLLDRENRIVVAQVEVDNPARPKASVKQGRSAIPADQQKMVTDGPAPFAPRTDVLFGAAARLIKMELPAAPAKPGTDVTLHWWFEAKVPLPRFTDLFVHLKGPTGQHLNVSHGTVGGNYLPDAWQKGEVIEDVHAFTLPADWAPGKTEVLMGFWDRNAKTVPGDPASGRLPIVAKQVAVDAELRAHVGSFEVKK